MSLYNPRITFEIVYPDGSRMERTSDVAGWLTDRQFFVDTSLHGSPIGTVIANLRQVNRQGQPFRNQPRLLAAEVKALPDEFHVKASAFLQRAVEAHRAKKEGKPDETPKSDDATPTPPGVRRGAARRLAAHPVENILTASYVPAEDDEDVYTFYPGVKAFRPSPPSPGEPIKPPTMEVPDPTVIDEPLGAPEQNRTVRHTVSMNPSTTGAEGEQVDPGENE
jgi:hypothetical protein